MLLCVEPGTGHNMILTSNIHPQTQPVKLEVECGILPKAKGQLDCCACSVPAWLINTIKKKKVLILYYLWLCVESWGQFFYLLGFLVSLY